MMRNSSLPQARYMQAKTYVLDKMRSGEWRPGQMILSENQLVAELGMSRMTINRALRELASEGLLLRLAGVGTFVADQKPQSSLMMIASLADEIRARGHRYTCKVLLLASESAAAPVAAALSLPVGSQVFHLHCVHYEEGVPVQLEDRYVNPQRIPNFIQQHFDENLTPSQYLLQVVPADEIEHIVDATLPSAEEAQLLEIGAHEACLVLLRRSWSQGDSVTYARFVHPSSRYRLGGRLSANGSYKAG